MLKKIYQKYKKAIKTPIYFNKSYSQYGEDLILASFLHDRSKGFYVDIGAHHPLRFSNAQYFYERGWRGINIDAMPSSMLPFQKHRLQDINIECGVDKTESTLDFYVFNEPALNGFSQELSFKREKTCTQYYIKKTIPVTVKTLSQILSTHLPKGTFIDFLSVDVEGLD